MLDVHKTDLRARESCDSDNFVIMRKITVDKKERFHLATCSLTSETLLQSRIIGREVTHATDPGVAFSLHLEAMLQ